MHHRTAPSLGVALLLFATLGCGGGAPVDTGGEPLATPTVLKSCKERRNCVCSQHDPTDAARWIAPLPYEGDTEAAKGRLKAVMLALPRTALVEEDGDFLHFTQSTLVFRWVDDVQFLVDREAGVIHVRSASRVGNGDLGVNRRRVERIRGAFATP